MAIGTQLFTFLFGKKIGTDSYGNCYYTLPPHGKKRGVLYKDEAEATKIPPGWYGWLHYTTDFLPNKECLSYNWEKPHQQNQTGTEAAYFPKGHMANKGKRPKVTGDYHAWDPSSEYALPAKMPNNN